MVTPRSADRILYFFFALIALATVLLELPISAHNRMVTDPVVAFTAVSAASTYGIQVVNTTTHWSLFGQAVILLVVTFAGGLGVMTASRP